jgi:hypothetical protein
MKEGADGKYDGVTSYLDFILCHSGCQVEG